MLVGVGIRIAAGVAVDVVWVARDGAEGAHAATVCTLEFRPVRHCAHAAPAAHEVCGERGEAGGGLGAFGLWCWREHATERRTCYISRVFFCAVRRADDLSERDAEHGSGQARTRRWVS